MFGAPPRLEQTVPLLGAMIWLSARNAPPADGVDRDDTRSHAKGTAIRSVAATQRLFHVKHTTPGWTGSPVHKL